MVIKNIIIEDFANYKKPSMFIGFPYCSFKCEKDCGEKCCQNSSLAQSENIEISVEEIIKIYEEHNIPKGIVCGGLEPFDSWEDLLELIKQFRSKFNDDIVIYTGYKEAEIADKVRTLCAFSPVIIKFGRFIPHQENHYDEILGVNLASPNQYARRLNDEI